MNREQTERMSFTELRQKAKKVKEIKEITLKNGNQYFLNPQNYCNPSLERAYVVSEGIICFVYDKILHIVEFSRAVIEILEQRCFKNKDFFVPVM